MKKNEFIRRCSVLAMIVVLMLSLCPAVLAESHSDSVIQLQNCEGEVRILDADGNSRPISEDGRFDSGESLTTGENAMASISLDETKVLTLDAMTQVTFTKENHHITLKLSSGRLLLDVQQKLDENETFEIQTSNMTVGIRGTVVYLTSFDNSEEEINKALLESNETFRELLNRTLPNGYSGNFSQLVVLEGAAVATYGNADGKTQRAEVHAGEKITVMDNRREDAAVSQATGNDLGSDMVEFIKNDPVLSEKVNEASDILKSDSNKQETESGIIEENEPNRRVPVVPDDIPPEHVHDFSPTFIPPTCTADGEIIYVCACGESFSVSGGGALGHDWGPWSVSTAATTERDGKEMCQCSRCGETRTQIIPKLDPTPSPPPTTAPTPTPISHTHTPVTVNGKDATCTEDGYTGDVVCESCQELITEGEVIPAKGHTPIEDPAVAATCTKPGKTAGSHCSVCETVITAQKTVPAKGHSGGTATCIKKAVCETCGQEYGELGEHQYKEVEPDIEPSCENPGMTAYFRCSVCDEAEIPSEEYGEPLGHLPASVWSSDGDCHWHACTRSGCEAQLDLEAHSFVDGKCTVCNYELEAVTPEG